MVRLVITSISSSPPWVSQIQSNTVISLCFQYFLCPSWWWRWEVLAGCTISMDWLPLLVLLGCSVKVTFEANIRWLYDAGSWKKPRTHAFSFSERTSSIKNIVEIGTVPSMPFFPCEVNGRMTSVWKNTGSWQQWEMMISSPVCTVWQLLFTHSWESQTPIPTERP